MSRGGWRPTPLTPMEREPQPVAASLGEVTHRLGIPDTAVLAIVFSRWEQLVGLDVASHTAPRSLRDGTLVIDVDHPAWATQLRWLSADLLARVRAETGSDALTEVRVRLGR
jgi:predicted nucleic acid-binding Zn ribbon protein